VTSPRLRSVCTGRTRPVDWGRVRESAIDKRPVPGRVRVGALGVDGDEQADRRQHGGVDQAVYAFAREDVDEWERRLGRALPDGGFGENLTTEGVDVTGARIGERWRIGSVLLEVSAPRIPCSTFQAHMGERAWVRRFTETGRPGAYMRVIEEGELGAGDPVEVVARPAHDVSIGLAFRALTTERSLQPLLLAADALPADVRAKLGAAAG
jgi:MOSC domain-containing protein YiiM